MHDKEEGLTSIGLKARLNSCLYPRRASRSSSRPSENLGARSETGDFSTLLPPEDMTVDIVVVGGSKIARRAHVYMYRESSGSDGPVADMELIARSTRS